MAKTVKGGGISYSFTADASQAEREAKKYERVLDATERRVRQHQDKLRAAAQQLTSGGAGSVTNAADLPAGLLGADERMRARVAQGLERAANRMEKDLVRRNTAAAAKAIGINIASGKVRGGDSDDDAFAKYLSSTSGAVESAIEKYNARRKQARLETRVRNSLGANANKVLGVDEDERAFQEFLSDRKAGVLGKIGGRLGGMAGKFGVSGGIAAAVGAAMLAASVSTTFAQGETARRQALRGTGTDATSVAAAEFSNRQDVYANLIGKIPVLGELLSQEFRRAADAARYVSQSMSEATLSIRNSRAAIATISGDPVGALRLQQQTELGTARDALNKAKVEADKYKSFNDSGMSREQFEIGGTLARDNLRAQEFNVKMLKQRQAAEVVIAEQQYSADMTGRRSDVVSSQFGYESSVARLNNNEIGAMAAERAAAKATLIAENEARLAALDPNTPQAALMRKTNENRMTAFDMQTAVMARDFASNPVQSMVTSAREAAGGAYVNQQTSAALLDSIDKQMARMLDLLESYKRN